MTSPEIVAVEFVNDAIDAVVLLFSDPAENVEAVDPVDVTVIVPLFVTLLETVNDEEVAPVVVTVIVPEFVSVWLLETVNVESSTAMP